MMHFRVLIENKPHVHNITKFVKKCYAGPLLKKEISAIDLVIKNKKNQLLVLSVDQKFLQRLMLLLIFLKKVNNLVIVGAMANNFFVYKNLKVGKSLIEKNTKEIIENIYKKAEENNCEILIPEDCMVGTDFEGTGKNKNLDEIKENEMILDIGLNTIKNIQKKINESNTVLWNGPAGYFENDNF